MRQEAYRFGLYEESHVLANLLIEYPNLSEIVRVKDYKGLKTGWEYSGHGAFGEAEHTRYNYVVIDKKERRVYDSEYLFLNENEVIKITYDSVLGMNLEKLSEIILEKFKQTIS